MRAPEPLFYIGAMSPYSWLAAERIGQVLAAARWHGVVAGAVFKANDRTSWGLTERRDEGMADCEQRAAQRGLGPIRWPDPWPTSDLLVARAVTDAAIASGVFGVPTIVVGQELYWGEDSLERAAADYALLSALGSAEPGSESPDSSI